MKVLTSNDGKGGQLLKVTVARYPDSDSLDTENLSQSNYSVLVPLDRLLAEMTNIKRKGARIVNIVSIEEALSEDTRSTPPNISSKFTPTIVQLWPNANEGDIQAVIWAAYKQVFGNIHILESERQISAESLLRRGSISVREFVRMLAKSDLYKDRFFTCTNNNRFTELNFKHLLGRTPYNQSEIVEHLDRYQSKGYYADIDSYIESDEYERFFGNNIVPYLRSFQYQVGQLGGDYTRMLRLYGGDAGSDTNLNQKGQVRLASPKELLRAGRGIV
jgi:phycocyanin-associated rod linker protein